MSRTSGALRQRTSNCRDRYFAVRLYIELKTVLRGGYRRRRQRPRYDGVGDSVGGGGGDARE